MADYGSMDTSTTSLGANQFPISEVWTPSSGFSATQGGPKTSDASGKASAPVATWATPVIPFPFIQKASNVSSGSVASLVKAFSSNNASGNTIIVVAAVGNNTAPTISDSAGNTYEQAAEVANGSAFCVGVWFSNGSAVGGGIAQGANSVTVTNGGANASIAMEIYEVAGLLTAVSSQPSKTATASGSSGTASTSALSPGTPNQYAFSGIAVGTAAQTIAVGSGWTNDSGQQNPTTPAGLFSFVSMSQYLGGLKSVTPQATFSSEPWAIAVAFFKPVIIPVEGSVKVTDGTNTLALDSSGNAQANITQIGGVPALSPDGSFVAYDRIRYYIAQGKAFRAVAPQIATGTGSANFIGFLMRANNLSVDVFVYRIVAISDTNFYDGRMYYNTTGANTDSGLTVNLLTSNTTNQKVGGSASALTSLSGSPASTTESSGMGGSGAIQVGLFGVGVQPLNEVLSTISQVWLPKSSDTNFSCYTQVTTTAKHVGYMIEWLEL